ncbi:cGMP-dependent protein kinase 1-like [Euwallacea fornicatus]|uniref:cGMP-dependent protein kinase 1-like n=1 Tax=Euwallacea fornicatus TaxID=995702 RepID=UPI00338D91FA
MSCFTSNSNIYILNKRKSTANKTKGHAGGVREIIRRSLTPHRPKDTTVHIDITQQGEPRNAHHPPPNETAPVPATKSQVPPIVNGSAPKATNPDAEGQSNVGVTLPDIRPSTPSPPSSTSDGRISVGDQLSGSKRSSGESMNEDATRRPGIPVSVPTVADPSSDEELPVFSKTPEDEEEIKSAIQKNEFLTKILSGKRLQDIVNAMQLRPVPAKKNLIKQGDKGSEMYISKEGSYSVLVKKKVVDKFNDTRVFGELAILYNAKRLATIQAVTAGKVWVLDRHVYQNIVIRSNLKEEDEILRFLRNVEYLNVANENVLRQVSNLLKLEFFSPGSVIVRQGDKGDKFYIIRAGTVTISKTGQGFLGKRSKGECFGEMALQKEDTRQATVTADTPGVECLTLSRRNFIDHFGDVQIPAIPSTTVSTAKEVKVSAEFIDVKLEDVKIIRTLGIGGFGRVELVYLKKQKSRMFALKYLKKVDIVEHNQQEHVYNEKQVQMNCTSPFIVRLYRTFKDAKYVYFLMDCCLAGDLFSLLHSQKNKRFEEEDAKFMTACVLEALEYLHSKGIVYRDLKPENLLVDKNGYLKLTDFGFAKQMPPRGKTFTFAGTPEYMAPEIVLNTGHDKAVDYWAFGVFVFEMLTGRTPFRSGDSSNMRTYTKILAGIDNVKFPTYISVKARNLIEKLCKPISVERLGMQRGGAKDIKTHRWYQGFEWQKFQNLEVPSNFKPNMKKIEKNLDVFKLDKNIPADELSGWDVDF